MSLMMILIRNHRFVLRIGCVKNKRNNKSGKERKRTSLRKKQKKTREGEGERENDEQSESDKCVNSAAIIGPKRVIRTQKSEKKIEIGCLTSLFQTEK